VQKGFVDFLTLIGEGKEVIEEGPHALQRSFDALNALNLPLSDQVRLIYFENYGLKY
jgi:hypothetical protein